MRVAVQDGVVVLGAQNEHMTLAFLGASCPASVSPGTSSLSSVTLSPRKGEDAVVALINRCQYTGSKTADFVQGGLVRLGWEKNKIIVKTDEPFVSCPSRLGQVIPDYLGHGSLQVKTAGQTFCFTFGNFASGRKKEFLNQGCRMVEDADMLCRYLVDKAGIEELEAAASGDLRTAEQIRNNKLQSELDRLVTRGDKAVRRMQEEIEEQVTERNRICRLLEKEHDRCRNLEAELVKTLRERGDLQARVDEVQAKLDATPGARLKRFWEKVRTAPASR
jgi:hypothetical protein